MRRTFRAVAAISLAALLLTGCGTGTSSSTAGEAGAADSPGGAYSAAQVRDIRQCLRAAGFHHLLPLEAQTGSPTTGATDVSTPDAGGPIGFRPGIRFSDPKLTKALHTCGLTLPGFAPAS
jgi:hypothetical protein